MFIRSLLISAVFILSACQPAAQQVAEQEVIKSYPADEKFDLSVNTDQNHNEFSKTITCKENIDFDVFFGAFVESPELRRERTLLDLRSELVGEYPTDFDGFRIGNVDNRWTYVDPLIPVEDWPNLDIEQKKVDEDYRVEYRRARYLNDNGDIKVYGPTMNYLFRKQDGCWFLVEKNP